MTTPLKGVTPGTRGGARELLDHVADIANILAHQNARSVNLTGGVSVSLRSKLRFSDVDVERALLLHHCPLHRASTDAQTLADLQYARAALVKAHDALFQLGSDA